MKFYHFCGITAIAALALTGCKGSKGDSSAVVAKVGSVSITNQEYYDYLQRKPKFLTTIQGRDQAFQVKYSPGYQAMQDLIVDKLIEELAHEQNVFPTDSDVEAEFNLNLKQNPNLVNNALAQGYSLDELKNDFRLQLCRFKLATRGVTVTPQEVDDFIKNNPKKFTQPARVEASIIVIKDAKTKSQVDSALNSGTPFRTVAEQYSVDKSNNHEFPVTDESQMSAPLRALFDETPELKPTKWVDINAKQGIQAKFYIEKKIAPTPVQITDQVKEVVRRLLMQQKGHDAGIDVNKEIADKIQADKDKIIINYKPNDAPWKDFTKQVGSALAAAPTGSSAAPGAGEPKPGATAPSASAPAGAAKK